MEYSMRRCMKVGLIHFMAFPSTIGGEGPILETLEKIATDTYFDAVSISWIKNPSVRREAKKMLEEARLEVSYGAHPRLLSQGLNLNHLNTSERRKAVEQVRQAIDEAVEMGARSVVFLSGHWEETRREEAYQALVESTCELCEYAGKQGDLFLIHENFDAAIDKKSLIGPTPLAVRYAEEVSSRFDNFGLLVDLSHIPLNGESPREALVPAAEYLKTVDLGNCLKSDPSSPRYGDTHPRFGYPGGENDVPEVKEFLETLIEIGFLNEEEPPVVSFEVRPFEGESPDLYIANAKRTLNEAWSLIQRAPET